MILAESSAQSVAPWLALAVAIAAAGIAVWQAWEARKARTDAQGAAEQAAQAQADAASHAGRAAAAAETSADHQERMAKALEKGTERYRNLWAIRPARGQLYVLTNRTNLPAEAVHIDPDSPLSREVRVARIEPGSSETFRYTGTDGSTGAVTVTYRPVGPGAPDDDQTWRGNVHSTEK